jgi:hypothetical protein
VGSLRWWHRKSRNRVETRDSLNLLGLLLLLHGLGWRLQCLEVLDVVECIVHLNLEGIELLLQKCDLCVTLSQKGVTPLNLLL